MSDIPGQSALPLAIHDILQLASREPFDESYQSGLIEYLTWACRHFDRRSARWRAAPAPRFDEPVHFGYGKRTQSFDQDEIPINDPTFVDAQVPACLHWVQISKGVAGLSPAVLHSTHPNQVDHAACFLVRALTLRYLAARLAMEQDALPDDPREAERSLLLTAKTQRTMLSVLATEVQIFSEGMTLAIKSQENEQCYGYLIRNIELCEVESANHSLISRAQAALFQNKENENCECHSILMTDSLKVHSIRGRSHRVFDHGIHLIGNPDEVKYIILVSGVSNRSEKSSWPEKDYTDPYKGRFRISSSKLRDKFLGRTSTSAAKWNDSGPVQFARHASPLSYVYSFGGFPPLDVEMDDANGHGVEESESETLISNRRIARRFFGYRGLREPTPK
jgi:hypothetical protein